MPIWLIVVIVIVALLWMLVVSGAMTGYDAAGWIPGFIIAILLIGGCVGFALYASAHNW